MCFSNINISDFYCVICGQKGIPIVRKNSKLKEKGHLKKLWCLKCQKETNHCEIKNIGGYTYNDFLEELNNKNFDEYGNRRVSNA